MNSLIFTSYISLLAKWTKSLFHLVRFTFSQIVWSSGIWTTDLWNTCQYIKHWSLGIYVHSCHTHLSSLNFFHLTRREVISVHFSSILLLDLKFIFLQVEKVVLRLFFYFFSSSEMNFWLSAFGSLIFIYLLVKWSQVFQLGLTWLVKKWTKSSLWL